MTDLVLELPYLNWGSGWGVVTRGEEPVSITKLWAQALSRPLGQLGSWQGTEGVFPGESLLE